MTWASKEERSVQDRKEEMRASMMAGIQHRPRVMYGTDEPGGSSTVFEASRHN